ncbi:MAG TPA: prolyl oligopeptidase family serine peptidase [Gaiellaceae bacterium]
MVRRPYGTWPSALDAATVARASGKSFSALDLSLGRPRWAETRADEGGRAVVVDEQLGDLTPAGSNARTRAHEYGGGAVWYHGDAVFYSEFTDGRVHRVGHGPITPEGGDVRYADGAVSADGSIVYCVRERHEGETVTNELVSFPADGSAEPTIVAGGRDFYMAPRPSPDGARLAWLEWDHPRMPWDGTELVVDGTRVAGGSDVSVLDPQWSPDGRLHWLADDTGWWNLYAEGEQLTRHDDAEIGFPAWVFGMTRYAFLGDGDVVYVLTRRATDELWAVGRGRIDTPWTAFAHSIAAHETAVALVAASGSRPPAVVTLDVDGGAERIVRRSLEVDLDPASVSVPRAIEFPTTDGEGAAHAFFYPPASADSEGPDDERPPLRVICHGGPTAHSSPQFDIETQYFTSRGIGVVDVNYRGSTGYGRAYRELLNGRWGVVDWQDCIAAARYLAEQGDADPDRTWVEGGSAGGYVVFCAMTFEPAAFAAGVSYFGVADAEALATDTHKFESRYLDSMIGPYPERADLYRERSPIHVADRLERPMLLLQGLDDKVVLPAQAEMMVEVLERKGIPYEYIAFEGEGHGFRKEENIVRSLEATLAFVGEVFGLRATSPR